MAQTYVVAPNFSMAPPPRLWRRDETQPTASSPEDVQPFSRLVELQLGDIVLQPFGAQMKALNRSDRQPIDSDDFEKLSSTGPFSETRKNLFKGRLGFWASLLATFGFGPDVNIGVHWESLSSEKLELDDLETRRFRVTEEYVQKVLESESVKKHWGKFRTAPMYIVSGLKYGSALFLPAYLCTDDIYSEIVLFDSYNKTTVGADLGASDNSDLFKLKVLEFLHKRSTETTFKSASDFILAVQFTHVHVKVVGKKATAEVGDASTKHGSMAGAEDKEEQINLEYTGADNSLQGAEDAFFEDIEKLKDDDENAVLIPDISA
ncbi:hypothetical protein FDECE_6900 [Fusarium decemcellulare]|nr:hypothetical protein FDECE_6900 [Fusarium decemcellulare]